MIDWIANNAGMTGLLFFFSVFCVIAFWAFRPANRERIEDYRNIPLREDTND
jgi:cbb3-type cytochrome oxidase subunit 3